MTTRASAAARNARPRRWSRGWIHSVSGGSGIRSRSVRMRSRRSEDMRTSTTHVTQGLAQRRADRPATDPESVGDLLLGEPEVVVGDDDRALAPSEQTQELAEREAIEQRLGLGRYLRLAKRADKLVEAEGQPEASDVSRAPERDTE